MTKFKKDSSNADQPIEIIIDPIFERTDIDYSVMKKALDNSMRAINLKYINDIEFRFDGKRYLKSDQIKNAKSIPSRYRNEIIIQTVEVCSLLFPPIPLSEFIKKNKLSNIWSFLEKDGFVYDLLPDVIITPNYLKHYKFFLPFVLRHCQPNNIAGILFYHRNEYYSKIPEEFYYLIQNILEEREEDFWIHPETMVTIDKWLTETKPFTDTKDFYWFELKEEFEISIKKGLISLLLDDLKRVKPPFIDPEEDFTNFYRLFSSSIKHKKFRKVYWSGTQGELHHFIKILETKATCSTVKKWVACTNLFFIHKKDFSVEQVRENKHITPKRKEIIKRIIGRIRYNT